MANNTLLILGMIAVLGGGTVAGYLEYQKTFDECLEELRWNGLHTNWEIPAFGYISIEYVDYEELLTYLDETHAYLYCDIEDQVIWTWRQVGRTVEIKVYRHNTLDSVSDFLSTLSLPG